MLCELEAAGATCEVRDCAMVNDDVDVIYLNRLQEERFDDRAIFEQNRLKYRLQRSDVEGSEALILDPLPRIDEISTDVDSLPNAVYFKQTSYGVPVRMALLASLLGKA
jgi:aspartate carbamoyltransferase catalytic subunit